MKLSKSIAVCFITVASIAAVKADVKPARLFMDNMVVQRETQAPVWGWADAEMVTREGADCVVVSSAEVKVPVAVRYAWADNPAECNLYSKEGFPASSFRTDDWKLPASPPTSEKKAGRGGR